MNILNIFLQAKISVKFGCNRCLEFIGITSYLIFFSEIKERDILLYTSLYFINIVKLNCYFSAGLSAVNGQ